MHSLFVSLIICCITLVPSSVAEDVLWMSVSGDTLFGALERVDHQHVWIRATDGRLIHLPIARLDARGREKVAAWRKASTEQPVYGRDIRRPPTEPRNAPPGEDRLRRRERALAEAINAIRKKHGLEPLEFHSEAADVARAHSEHMATAGFFAHQDPEGRQVWDRLQAARVRYEGCGENIALNQGVADPDASAVTGWMNSPGHRANILQGDWKSTGMGMARKADGSWLFTQVFLR